MMPLFQKIKLYVVANKIISAVALGIIVIGGGYMLFGTKAAAETRYVTTTVQKGSIIASVTASGQVTATNSIDVKAKNSGTITYVGVKAGDVVRRSATLFFLDARDAEKAVRNAQTDLESAQLDLEKFQEGPKNVDVLTLNSAIADAKQSKIDAAKKVADAYRALLNSSITVSSSSSTSTDVPPTISGTYTKDEEGQIVFTVHRTGDGAGYFSVASVPSDIVTATGSVSTTIPQPIGDTGLYIKFPTNASLQNDWTLDLPNKTVASYAANLTAYQQALTDQEQANSAADLAIAQNQQKITDLYTPDPLDLRAKQLAVQQKQNALSDAKQTLSDYYVGAPFDGTVSSVVGKLGDTASGTLATIITKQKLAAVTLNEVDVSKIKLGDKATLTFDAIDGLTISGEVAEIDTVGTVTQGVVNYTVKVSFDTDDDRVKPGMTVSAAIITDSKQDVLVVPSSAVKTNSTGSYVEMFDKPLVAVASTTPGVVGTVSLVKPNQIPVEVGISDDTSTEITSGLQPGDQIVSRTITTTTTKTSTTAAAPSLFGSTSTRGFGGGGATRAATGR